MQTCPCGSNVEYEKCCLPVIRGERTAASPEEVMRARYTAYARKEFDYLFNSLHPDHRSDYDPKATKAWAEMSEWHRLEILSTTGGGPEETTGTVEFVATYTEKGTPKAHHEAAAFVRHEGVWYFESGEPVRPKPVVRTDPKVGRNDPCSCGSGKKFKKCCG